MESRQQAVVINGVKHIRVLVPKLLVDAATQQQIESWGISPWLVALGPVLASPTKTARQAENENVSTTSVSNKELQLVLVGAFTNIDEALALERRLAEAALPVRGEAKLAGGKVIHQVWVGPTSDLSTLQLRLQKLNLTASEVRDASASETAFVERAVTQEFKQEAPKPKVAVAPSNRYPRDFNLARLPEKRTRFPIKP